MCILCPIEGHQTRCPCECKGEWKNLELYEILELDNFVCERCRPHAPISAYSTQKSRRGRIIELVLKKQGYKCNKWKEPYEGCATAGNDSFFEKRGDIPLTAAQLDHINPVMGDRSFPVAIDEIQVLCGTCHSIKSAADRKIIKEAKEKLKQLGQPSKEELEKLYDINFHFNSNYASSPAYGQNIKDIVNVHSSDTVLYYESNSHLVRDIGNAIRSMHNSAKGYKEYVQYYIACKEVWLKEGKTVYYRNSPMLKIAFIALLRKCSRPTTTYLRKQAEMVAQWYIQTQSGIA